MLVTHEQTAMEPEARRWFSRLSSAWRGGKPACGRPQGEGETQATLVESCGDCPPDVAPPEAGKAAPTEVGLCAYGAFDSHRLHHSTRPSRCSGLAHGRPLLGTG